MAKFNSLTSVILDQLDQQKNIDQNSISFRSPTSSQLRLVRPDQDVNVLNKDALRWGTSFWGLEKVTSQYKPNEVK
jgi:hypothetical protein